MTVSDPSPIDRVERRGSPCSRGGTRARRACTAWRSRVTRSTPGMRLEARRAAARAAGRSRRRPRSTVRAVARVLERRQPLGQDQALHADDLGLGGSGPHHHEHLVSASFWRAVIAENKKAEVRDLCSPGTTRQSRVVSLRGRSCRAGKAIDGAHRWVDGSPFEGPASTSARAWRERGRRSCAGSRLRPAHHSAPLGRDDAAHRSIRAPTAGVSDARRSVARSMRPSASAGDVRDAG